MPIVSESAAVASPEQNPDAAASPATEGQDVIIEPDVTAVR